MTDSLGRPQRGFANPQYGGLLQGEEQYPRISMFGTQIDPREMQYVQRQKSVRNTHAAPVAMGSKAVPAIERFVTETDMTLTLRQELLAIVSEINVMFPTDLE